LDQGPLGLRLAGPSAHARPPDDSATLVLTVGYRALVLTVGSALGPAEEAALAGGWGG
jgi:hypothetical protein